MAKFGEINLVVMVITLATNKIIPKFWSEKDTHHDAEFLLFGETVPFGDQKKREKSTAKHTKDFFEKQMAQITHILRGGKTLK